ncbi:MULTISPECIES: N-acetylmuramoyl-L-alanine amidase [unclassified Roseitalea]|uniref:N-acetylmuramoyl-L-alanine amidase n=1 Tax=unclassified Roseitalea TaxID=2639107 RepID=UPI00273EC868|nr:MULTISPECIES: N-acetylmuramoyl-L-alanine amidase [unclassified Roseitalea]
MTVAGGITGTIGRAGAPAWPIAMVFVALLLAIAPARTAFDAPVAVEIGVSYDRNGAGARLEIGFDRQVSVSHQLLDHPFRLVLDFERIGYGFELDEDDLGTLFETVRYGDMGNASSRMIFELAEPLRVDGIESGPSDGLYRLAIDLSTTDAQSFRRAMIDTMQTSSIVVRSGKSDRLGAKPLSRLANQGDFVVVLDPGHGGIDSGAIGVGGTREKDVVLQFAHQMRAELEKIDGIDVVMTRTDDVFIALNDRVRFARQRNASLFVSLHADSVRQSYVRGATVYTISNRASDDVAAEIARSENLSDSIAGITYEDELSPVTDILVDLARQETLGFSVQFARILVSHISKSWRMINNPHRFAGFRVLKAPDVPSVLVELGYLSNKEDEVLLNDEKWRAGMAAELAAAVTEYAELAGRRIAARQGE